MDSTETIAKTAKAAFESAQLVDPSERVRALHEIAAELESSKAAILAANQTDLAVRVPPSLPSQARDPTEPMS